MASTADPSAPTNRLARESSPYLRLHEHNPVDWYPWGEEALTRARREDKPIFLSVGYSTCYWCHVMERESFSHPEIAALMNERFVNIKVDREERPDLDEIYMAATQVLAGQGGWPNSVFLTPSLKPFYAGTYFPPTDRWGRPGFVNLVVGLAEAWQERRVEVDLQAEEVAGAMKRLLEERFPPGHEVPGPEVAIAAYRGLVRTFDHDHGGFGRAPKFPSPSNLYLLQALAEVPEAPRAAELLGRTLDAMARGGLYDQLGGGFHRYATDAAWQVPHFEKMLYDNALLLELYALEAERRGGDEELERVVRETAEFLAREMTGPHGELWSAIDAETHGHEGAFYVWTREELDALLGEEDATFLAPLQGFDGPAFFEGNHYVLHLPAPVEELAARRRTTPARLWELVNPLRARLLAARAERERPATDDKVLADWNGMAIRGLAVAARVLGDPELAARAVRAADYVLAHHRAPGQPLLHATHRGAGRIPAFLSDYVFFVRGLLALAAVTGERRFEEEAVALTEEQIARLAHPQGGFYNAAAGEDLLVRSQEILDGATPAANGVAVLNLLDLAALTGNAHYRELAEQALATFSPLIGRAPDAARTLALACWRLAGASGQPIRAGLPLTPSDGPEWVTPRLTVAEPTADGVRAFELELEIAPGWHINAHPASEEWLIPTEIEPLEGTELLDVVYPDSAPFEPAPSAPAIAVYQGQVTLTGHLRGRGEFVFTYQPCDEERCLPPVRRVVG